MKVVIQRVKKSNVSIENKIVGHIDNGLLVLVGFTLDDTINDINYIVKKIVHLRIFDDENGIMNKSVLDVGGKILSVSQFTLYADSKKGNRPSYSKALNREKAIPLYETFNKELEKYVHVETGVFGAEMEVSLINDGPITIIIDSKE